MIKSYMAVLGLLCISFTGTFGQSKAHERSESFIIDPAYNAVSEFPKKETVKGAPWLYGYAEYESWRLQMLRREGIEAKLRVGYPGEYHEAYTQCTFRLQNKQVVKAASFQLYTNSAVTVKLNGRVIYAQNERTTPHLIKLPINSKNQLLEIALKAKEGPPALLIKTGPFATSNLNWEWQAGGEPWQQPARFAQNSNGQFPHLAGAGKVKIKPLNHHDNLYDFGRELLAHVWVSQVKCPVIGVGESVNEANDTTAKAAEQSLEMVSAGKGQWRSKHALAFRYVKVYGEQPTGLSAEALFHPTQYKGAFACSDTLLTRIWMNSAYTLRLCSNDFLMDGIKRDRLPWAGDLAMSMMVNAYTFGDGVPVRQSIAVLNRAGIKNQDINGIIDYDLWWLIAQNQYQLYYKDQEHLRLQWPRIKETMDILAQKCDSLGFLNVKNAKWLFIDWVKVNKSSTLQIMWWWAQQSAIALAKRMGDQTTVQIWQGRADTLKSKLFSRAWNATDGTWMDDPYKPEKISRHANIVAVVSGLSGAEQYSQISNSLNKKEVTTVGTPYMSGFEDLAMAKLGNADAARADIRRIWGGMLSHTGTTTFWEAYNPAEKPGRMYSFYSRPYGKSLCHAWSSGPGAVLPAVIFGIQPLTDGWKTFAVNPQLGDLQWASGAIPSPAGNITIDVVGSRMKLQVPAGLTAVWQGQCFKGPQVIDRLLK